MKKNVMLSLLLCLAVFLFAVLLYRDRHMIRFKEDGNGQLCLEVKYDLGYKTIKPWFSEDDGIWYFFLPSHIDDDQIWCGELEENALCADGVYIAKNMTYTSGQLYSLAYHDETYQVVFRQTTNLSTLFIDTDSGSMDYVHADKENEEAGRILSVDNQGKVFYEGELDKISGRGNATWGFDKKPYHIKLSSEGELAGLSAASGWNLLAMRFDGDKIHSKLCFDIEKILGGRNSVENTWVNLYTNGEYRGIYLLTGTVGGQDDFNQMQDEFLLEKEISGRYEEKSFFLTENGNPFVVVRPKEVSREALDSIAEIIQHTEDAINAQEISDVIDVDSFAVQFLVDEISLNYDAFRTSAYIYKRAGVPQIYAGPAWDYDAAFGEYVHRGEEWVNPDGTVLVQGENQLDWYDKLYANDVFYDYVADKYEEKLSELEALFTDGIEEYALLIADSAANDDLRWRWTEDTLYRAGTYQTWENDVRYLQYFCINRLKVLCLRWDAGTVDSEWTGTGELHNISFRADDEVLLTLKVKDGDTINTEDIEELGRYTAGSWTFSYSGETFNQYLPILEDCELVFVPW